MPHGGASMNASYLFVGHVGLPTVGGEGAMESFSSDAEAEAEAEIEMENVL